MHYRLVHKDSGGVIEAHGDFLKRGRGSVPLKNLRYGGELNGFRPPPKDSGQLDRDFVHCAGDCDLLTLGMHAESNSA